MDTEDDRNNGGFYSKIYFLVHKILEGEDEGEDSIKYPPGS